MFKKFIFSIIASVLFVSSFLYSQETKLQQYQTFSWGAIKNARKYEVAIEKLQDDETWIPETSQITTATRLEMLLYPGKYRVSIGAFNVLNRKASQSEWVTFIILDETEPFIFESTFNGDKNSIGSLYTKPYAPVIETEQLTEIIPVSESTEQNTEIAQFSIEQNETLVADNKLESTNEQEEVYPQNTFRILGKNIYFSETEFFLVPVEPDSSLTDAVTSYTIDRPKVKLDILSRDSSKNEVVVSYDETQLYTGLYNLVVENPGNLTASINVNVYTSNLCQLNNEQYEYNKRYQVPTLQLIRSDETNFIIEGTNFSSDGEFSLIPAEGIPYPYSSIGKRVSVPLELNDYSELDSNSKSTALSFLFNPSIIETGYYLFTADYGSRGSVTELLLIDILPPPDIEPPQIMSLKSKYNKKQNTLEFTVSGTELDSDARGVLISPFSEDDGKNERRTVTLTDFGSNKKKIIMDVETENLGAGTYAFLLETNGCRAITYVTIDEKFKAKLEEIPPEQIEEIFLRPENLEVAEDINIGTLEVANARIDFDAANWMIRVQKVYSSSTKIVYAPATTSTFEVVSSKLNITAALNKGDTPTGNRNSSNDYSEYVQCLSISNSDIDKLQTGDSIRIKMNSERIKRWGIAFICTDENGKETKYECPFKMFAELKEDSEVPYYCVEGKYDELWDTTWDFKAKKPFKAENVTDMYFYTDVTSSTADIEISDFEIFDSSTIPTKLIKVNPHFFTNGQVRIEGTKSTTNVDELLFKFGFSITPFDFKYVSSEIMYLFDLKDRFPCFEASLKVNLAYGLIEPYVGGGIGITSAPITSCYYIPLYAGIKLLRLFDFRYNCNLVNVKPNPSAMYLKDSFSFGFSLWFKTQKIKRVPKEIENE